MSLVVLQDARPWARDYLILCQSVDLDCLTTEFLGSFAHYSLKQEEEEEGGKDWDMCCFWPFKTED